MEIHATRSLKRILQKKHSISIFCENPGMTIDHKYPFFSVSPDAEGCCTCCGKFLIEIKCPYSICETVPTSENLSYLNEIVTDKGQEVQLKHNHSYYAQIQGQMSVINIPSCWFFVYTEHGYH